MQGYFYVNSNENEEKYDIKCELNPDYAKVCVPQEQQDLYIEIESTNNIIKSLHNTKDDIKNKYFVKLLSLAQAGLVSEAAQPELALKSIEKLKEEIVLVEGQRIKNEYMKKLGITAIKLSVPIVIMFLIFDFYGFLDPILMYFIAFLGALLGTWISFGARKFIINFSQLSLLEEDMMTPWIRLIYIGFCAVIFLLLLNTEIVKIEIGNISTSMIKNSVEIQASIGILCGLVESKIGINIYNKAVDLLGSN